MNLSDLVKKLIKLEQDGAGQLEVKIAGFAGPEIIGDIEIVEINGSSAIPSMELHIKRFSADMQTQIHDKDEWNDLDDDSFDSYDPLDT